MTWHLYFVGKLYNSEKNHDSCVQVVQFTRSKTLVSVIIGVAFPKKMFRGPNSKKVLDFTSILEICQCCILLSIYEFLGKKLGSNNNSLGLSVFYLRCIFLLNDILDKK